MNYLEDIQLDEIMYIMREFNYPWFIAGGWSIDLYLGRKTREHKDMDIVIDRKHARKVLHYFKDWSIGVAVPGENRLEPIADISTLDPPRYCLHITSGNKFVEVLLTEIIDNSLIYRRDPSVKLCITDAIRIDEKNRRFITPEWQLLFKSKSTRDIDNHDFEVVIPKLSYGQKKWLKEALIKTGGNKVWVQQLS